MKVNLKKESWHYKFNRWMNSDRQWNFEQNTKDFCSYFWMTFFNILKVLFVMGIIGVFCLMVYLIVQRDGWMPLLKFIGTLIGIFFAIFTFFGIKYYTDQHEAGLIRLSYRKFREKTCHKIDWK